MEPGYLIAIGVLSITAVTAGVAYSNKLIEDDKFKRRNLLKR